MLIAGLRSVHGGGLAVIHNDTIEFGALLDEHGGLGQAIAVLAEQGYDADQIEPAFRRTLLDQGIERMECGRRARATAIRWIRHATTAAASTGRGSLVVVAQFVTQSVHGRRPSRIWCPSKSGTEICRDTYAPVGSDSCRTSRTSSR